MPIALIALAGAAGCGPPGAPTAVPAQATAAAVEPPLPADVATALAGDAPGALDRAAPPAPPHAVRRRAVGPPPDGAAPLTFGAWSPDGRHVVAFTAEAGGVDGDLGRLWVIDAGPHAAVATDAGPAGAAVATIDPPTWAHDSGDVVAAPGRDAVAAWRGDGRLVVARAPDLLIDMATDRPLPFADVAPRSVAVAPDGITVLAAATDRAWLIGADGAARPVAGYPVGLAADAFAWRAAGDGELVAAAIDAAGGLWRLDVGAAAARQISQLTWADDGDHPARPIWLADGQLLVPRPVRLPGGGALDVALVDGESGAIEGLAAWAGLPPPPALPDGWQLAAPNGRWLIAPVVTLEQGRPALAGARIAAVDGPVRRDVPPVGDPRWAPNGTSFAVVEAGAVLTVDAATGGRTRRFDGGALRVTWSPDSRRLAVVLADGGLALVEADGTRGPARVADDVDPRWPPSWSGDGRRLAITVRPADGPASLAILDIEDPPTPD